MKRIPIARAADSLVVVLLAVSGVVQIWTMTPGALEGGKAVHTALLAVITLPLFVRIRYSLAVCLTVWGVSWLQYQLGGELGQPFFAGVLALYSVGAHAPYPQTALGALGAAAAILATDIPRLAAGDRVEDVVPLWFILAGVWGFGRWMRRRRAETVSLSERAVRAEQERDEKARRAVAEERARIARELHDLVAHSMGVIVIQSQAAQRVLDRDPTAARSALEAIETAGREGLSEMRRLLGLITGSEAVDRSSPQPTLERLDELVEQVRGAGLPVELRVHGEPRPLTPGMELTAYRIVQEALTNTLKHAGPAEARVEVRYMGSWLELEVADTGRGVNGTKGSGHGLVGMRERVALYGGTLEIEDSAKSGFRVLARIPVARETA